MTPLREAGAVFVIAVGGNFPWEMIQSYLYAPMGSWIRASSRCLLASLGDGLWVLLILSAGWLAFGRLRWFASPGWRGYLLVLASGILIAVAVEWDALSDGRWSYSDAMPLLPGTTGAEGRSIWYETAPCQRSGRIFVVLSVASGITTGCSGR